MSNSQPTARQNLLNQVHQILNNHSLDFSENIQIYKNVAVIGTKRTIHFQIFRNNDTLTSDNEIILNIICKAQDTLGSSSDKIFRTFEEINKDIHEGTPSILVFGGGGWNREYIRHLLIKGAIHINFFDDWLNLYFPSDIS